MIQRRRVFLSLCSGYSGESEAFIGEPGWCVVRIENDPGLGEVPHTRILDVVDWMDWIDTIPQPVELVWCSPPCTEFTTADSRPRSIRGEPDMSILQACMDVIDYLKPRTWIIENVKGAIRYFEPILGKPKQTIGPFFLWGKFPHIAVTVGFKGRVKYRINRDTLVDGPGGHWTFNGIPYNKWDTPNNACIPLEVSQKLLEAIDQQTTLGMYPSSQG